MWAGSGPATYSFTISDFPTDSSRTNIWLRMSLTPTTATGSAPEWDQADCIVMDLGVDDQGVANWYFRWKTNAPQSNGELYDPGRQVVLRDRSVLGKWTLSFVNDTTLSMTSPGGYRTNFAMGMHLSVPDISTSFQETGTNHGNVYLGLYTSGSFHGRRVVALSGAQLNGAIAGFESDWLTETSLDASQWTPVSGSVEMVATDDAAWVMSSVPEFGFVLQTNSLPAKAN
jgi:hypothetical protein